MGAHTRCICNDLDVTYFLMTGMLILVVSTFWLNSGGNFVVRNSFWSTFVVIRFMILWPVLKLAWFRWCWFVEWAMLSTENSNCFGWWWQPQAARVCLMERTDHTCFLKSQLPCPLQTYHSATSKIKHISLLIENMVWWPILRLREITCA